MIRIQGALEQSHLDDAAQSGGVQRDLLESRVAAGARERPVNVLLPQPAKPQDALRRLCQAPALICAMTASATWLVPTAVGSPRFSFRSYVTFWPTAITFAIAPSIASAAATSSR